MRSAGEPGSGDADIGGIADGIKGGLADELAVPGETVGYPIPTFVMWLWSLVLSFSNLRGERFNVYLFEGGGIEI
jgi:hypothetical protein